MAGHHVNCPGCGQRFQVPKESAPAAGTEKQPKDERQRGGWPEADPSNVNVWVSLLIGLAAMAATVGILSTVRDTFVGQVYFSGHWVTATEFVLFFWGLGMLLLKNRKNNRQRAALLLDVLPKSLGNQIRKDNVEKFIVHLYGLPDHLRDSMMVNRIRKALELFEARTNNSEVASSMNAQSNVDANRIAGSYALLKVFLWALPILGFIGTVIGLSKAMSGFGSTDLTDINALKNAVGVITSGLSEAFNTTLLGLLLSMLLIFPMSATQKREEDCLTDIDAFCNENLLSRLNDGGVVAGATSTTAAAAGPVEGLGEMFREIAMIQKQFVSDLEKVARSVEELTTVVKYAAQQIDERSKAHQQQVEKKLGESLDVLTAKANETVAANGKSVDKYVSRIAVGIESLNNALATLGEKRIVVQRPQSRGWFFNRKS